MFNKDKKRIIKELENEIEWLNKNYNDAKRDLEKLRAKQAEKPKPVVTVYLESGRIIEFEDANDFDYRSGDDLVGILKDKKTIGVIKISEITAISNFGIVEPGVRYY